MALSIEVTLPTPPTLRDILDMATATIQGHPFYDVALGFILGLLASVLAFSAVPAIWNCPTNPLLGQMVQLRKKRMRLSGPAGRSGGFGRFEMKDHYGLEQQVLNLDFEAPTMWMNVGFWKDNPHSLPEACQALLEEVLNVAGLSSHRTEQRFSVLEVGCGCAEPVRYLRQHFADALDVYIGITLNGCQAAEAVKRIEALGSTSHIDKAPVVKYGDNHIYCADAANPSSWPESLHETLKQVSSLEPINKSSVETHALWLLAIDTLYHFAPTRKHILSHACNQLGASLMATDIIIPDSISWTNWLKLRAVFFGLQVPWANILTRDAYVRMLVECGYERDKITMIDITEHCFAGFDSWTRGHMQRWEAMGGSPVITRAVRMMGWVMGWWARARVVREYIIIARK
ncbi:hypothetical protein BJY04DRAFT_222099 [Aspergillus karnatakaensis]|uniref:SAM-dependent methyltransferase n=1 Tax=Aspergillus karnatakaensis TaxID=1810916 RepID=UPI003CCE3F8E